MTMTAPKKKAKAEPLEVLAVTANELITEPVPPADDVAPAKPGDPDFDWSVEYPGEKFMVYTAKSGVTVGLAAMTEARKPTMRELKRILQKDQLQQMFETVERITTPAALDIAEGFKESDYTKMLDEWSEWSNTTMGES